MKNNAKQDALDAIDAAADMARLAASKSFRNIVEFLRRNRNDDELLCHKCQQFGLADVEWLKRVVEAWDMRGPLPAPRSNREADKYGQNAWIVSNKERAEGRTGKYAGAPYAYQSRMLKGSPRVSWERTLHCDPLGEEWLTLKVRITNTLSQKGIAVLARNSLFWATYDSDRRNSTKPSLRSYALQLLTAMPSDGTIYRLAQQLKKQFDRQGIPLSESSAKAHVRAWRKNRNVS